MAEFCYLMWTADRHAVCWKWEEKGNKRFFSCASWYVIYLLTAIGLPPGGSSTVHTYTQTEQRTTQNKQYIEQHKHLEQHKRFPETAPNTISPCLMSH